MPVPWWTLLKSSSSSSSGSCQLLSFTCCPHEAEQQVAAGAAAGQPARQAQERHMEVACTRTLLAPLTEPHTHLVHGPHPGSTTITLPLHNHATAFTLSIFNTTPCSQSKPGTQTVRVNLLSLAQS